MTRHHRRIWYVGRGVRIECQDCEEEYKPPSDLSRRVQEDAFRQHRIDKGERPPPRRVSVTVGLDEMTLAKLDATRGQMSRAAFVRQLVRARLTAEREPFPVGVPTFKERGI